MYPPPSTGSPKQPRKDVYDPQRRPMRISPSFPRPSQTQSRSRASNSSIDDPTSPFSTQSTRTSLTTPPPSGKLAARQPFWLTKNPLLIKVGSRVAVESAGIVGTLKFQGTTHFKVGLWAGIQLDVDGTGKNDGSVNGTRYFTCPPNTGIFVLASKMSPVHDSPLSPPPLPKSVYAHKAPIAASPPQPTLASSSSSSYSSYASSKSAHQPSPTTHTPLRKRQPFHEQEKRTTPHSPKIPPQPKLGPQDLPSPAPSPVQPSNRNTLTVKQSKPRAFSAPDLDLSKESPRQHREGAIDSLGVSQTPNTVRLRPSRSLATLKNVVSSEKAKIPAQTWADTCASCTILRHDLTNQAALTELSQKRMQSMENTIIELRNSGRESLEHYENSLKTQQQTNAALANTVKTEQQKVSRLEKEREELRKAGLDAIEVYEATLAELGAISEEKEDILASGRQQNAVLEQEKAELVGHITQANERHAQILAEAQAAKIAQVQAEKETIEARTALEAIRFKWEEAHQKDQKQLSELARLRKEVEEWKTIATRNQQCHDINDTNNNNTPHETDISKTRWLLQAEILNNLSNENRRLDEPRKRTNCHCFVSAISRLQKNGLKLIEEDSELDTETEWRLQKALLELEKLGEEHAKEIRDKQHEIHVLQRDIDELENAIEKNVFKEALTAEALENERRLVSRLQAELKDIKVQVTFLKGTRRMSSKRWVVSKHLDRSISDDDDDDNKESYCEICEVSGHDLMTCSVVMQQRPLTPATSVERLCTLPELSA